MSILADERGKASASRTLLVYALGFTAGMIVADSVLPWWTVADAAWVLLGGICTGLLAWAGGPRIAQYIGPQMGAVAAGIAAAAGRKTGTDDRRADDER